MAKNFNKTIQIYFEKITDMQIFCHNSTKKHIIRQNMLNMFIIYKFTNQQENNNTRNKTIDGYMSFQM